MGVAASSERLTTRNSGKSLLAAEHDALFCLSALPTILAKTILQFIPSYVTVTIPFRPLRRSDRKFNRRANFQRRTRKTLRKDNSTVRCPDQVKFLARPKLTRQRVLALRTKPLAFVIEQHKNLIINRSQEIHQPAMLRFLKPFDGSNLILFLRDF